MIKEDLLFRDRQLKRLKDEILDLEDFDDTVSLTDFSLDEFDLDLLRYLEANRSELAESAEGVIDGRQATIDAAELGPATIISCGLPTARPRRG